MIALLLAVSVLLATLRNILSKNISEINFGTSGFFLIQTIIFGTGGIFLAFTNIYLEKTGTILIFCSLIYGILLIAAQYCYTIALKSGKTGICATIYSLGFIFPALSGSVLWGERISICSVLGICTVIVMIVICGLGGKNTKGEICKKHLFNLIIAMLASGGLGIVQKFAANTDFKEQNGDFLVIAFAVAFVISFVMYMLTPNDSTSDAKLKSRCIVAFFIGIAFSVSNLCNTMLSGMLDSVILFPALNIGTIIFSVLSGIVIYKERMNKYDVTVLIMGVMSICLLNM